MVMLTACRQPEMKRCVDEHGVVVDDSLCATQPRPNPVGGYYPIPYRYYYGGYGGFGPGSMVSGGGYAPMSGHAYASSTERGGFGSTHAGGGEGGGE
jgi:hypothetical protein